MVSLFALRVRKACLGMGLALAGFAGVSAQAAERVPTEEDYFANVPVVLTASRLEQPLNEAPGAITVIDRHTIRLSGARTLAEVMRLVPGYLSGGWNGANQQAAYHIPIDDYGARNLVLIDGRSVYSSSYKGGTHRGMSDVMLEDIERIEVLRGANSAAYGANAMFGVINIITRHSADTVGGEVSLTSGDNGIRDRRARIGVGDETASFRLSVGEQRDKGYINAYDDRRLGLVNARADFKPSLNDDVMVAMGVSYLSAGEGYGPQVPDAVDNPLNTIHTRDSYVNFQWRRQVSLTDELLFSADYMEDSKKDVVPYPPLKQILLDFSGVGRRTNLELQSKMSFGDDVRAVLGIGYKDERALSKPLYARDDWVSFHEERVFGTLEWRATPQWLINAGLFVGQQSLTGTYTAPRLMVNWLPTPEHTFRAGVTTSVRPPSLFEYAGDVRYYLGGNLVGQTTAARGSAEPEKLRSQEIGYLGRFLDNRVTLDVRAYRERMSTFIDTLEYLRSAPLVTGPNVTDYVNQPGLTLTGAEYQLRWKPFSGTEVWLNQSFSHLHWDSPADERNDERRPPEHATVMGLFQQLYGGIQLSVIHERLGSMTWRDKRDWLAFARRTDVRLAYPFRIGTSKAEAAFTVQSAEGDRPFFLVRPQYDFKLARKNFLTLRVEM